MKKKIIALVLAITVLFGAIVGGTLAYLADTDSAVNVATVGNVKVKQTELQRADKNATLNDELIPFEQGQKLYPAYPKAGDASYTVGANGLWNDSALEGVMDKIVFVENTGKSDLYFRTWVAFECPTNVEFDKDILANLNTKGFTWTDPEVVTIGETNYAVVCGTYDYVLAPKTTAPASLLQVAMHHTVGNDKVLACGDTYEILAFTEAVQVENMPDADTALDAAFGADLPWPAEIKPSKTVYNAEELTAALNDGVEVVCLGADITVDADLTLKADKTLVGNGYTLTNAAIAVKDGARIENVKFVGAYGSAANVSVNEASASVYKCTFAVNSMARAGQVYIGATLNADNELVLKANTFYAGGIVDIQVADDEPEATEAAPVVTVEDNVAIAESWAEANAIFCSDLIEDAITEVFKDADKQEKVPAVSVWDGTADTSWYDKNPDAEVFVLEKAAQLAGLAQLVDGGNTFEGKTIKLASDMNLAALDENGNTICFDPIGSYRKEMPFSGTFDGVDHTIKGLSQNTWALNNGYYYGDLGLGFFGCVENATIKNVTFDGAAISGESALCGVVAGTAYGDCVFQKITVKNSNCADYQYYAGGIVGWASGNHQYIECVIDATTNIAAQWGDFDNSIGGVIGGAGGSAKILMKDCTVACRIDAYNDVTSTYQWYAYRRAGMLIGNSGKTTTTESGSTVAIAPQLTCENVTVIYGDWANYTYCEFAGTSWPYVRVQAGVSNSAYSNPRYGHPTDANGNVVENDNHVHNDGEDHFILCQFDQLYGGGQGVYGTATHEGVTVVYNNNK